MKKNIGTTIALCALTAGATFNITMLACQRQLNALVPEYLEQQALFSKLSELKGVIDDKYVGDYTEEDLLEMAAYGMVAGTADRWSSYLPAESVKQTTMNLQGKMVGIGVNVNYDGNPENGIIITSVYEDSPAEKAGLENGDIIRGAEDKTLQEHGYDAVLEAVKGEEGTMATLTVEHDGQTETYRIKRAEVQRTAVYGRMLEKHIGYVKLTDFDGGADLQCEEVMAKLLVDGADSFIFDVRYNPGGSVQVLANILDPLLPEGDIITLRPKEGRETVYSSDANAMTLPMAVLVNGRSISAAEFFAAALQEYGVATIVGEPTIGKGFSQRIYKLSDGSGVNLSDQKYFTPKGKNLADIGITPDVLEEFTEEQNLHYYTLTDEEDTQLQAAIRVIEEKLA